MSSYYKGAAAPFNPLPLRMGNEVGEREGEYGSVPIIPIVIQLENKCVVAQTLNVTMVALRA